MTWVPTCAVLLVMNKKQGNSIALFLMSLSFIFTSIMLRAKTHRADSMPLLRLFGVIMLGPWFMFFLQMLTGEFPIGRVDLQDVFLVAVTMVHPLLYLAIASHMGLLSGVSAVVLAAVLTHFAEARRRSSAGKMGSA